MSKGIQSVEIYTVLLLRLNLASGNFDTVYSYSLHHPDQEGKISVQKHSKADLQSCIPMSVLSRYNSFHTSGPTSGCH